MMLKGCGYRRLIIVLWREALRISGALALADTDLDGTRSVVVARRGKGRTRLEVGMHRWSWEQLELGLEIRETLPVGALF